MKTQIKKIIVGTAALLFVMTGISFAHDGDGRSHKPYGKRHGYYKVEKDHHHGDHRHYKARKHYRKKHAHRDFYHRHHYDKHHRHWKKRHAKLRRHHHDRYHYREARYHHHDKHHRRSQREELIYKIALKDPGIVFKLILNDY